MFHWAMLLTEDIGVIQMGGGVLLTINTLLLLKVTFAAGKLVEQIATHERRLNKLEEMEMCQADDCPMRKMASEKA